MYHLKGNMSEVNQARDSGDFLEPNKKTSYKFPLKEIYKQLQALMNPQENDHCNFFIITPMSNYT